MKIPPEYANAFLSLLANQLAEKELSAGWSEGVSLDALMKLASIHGVAGTVARAVIASGVCLSDEIAAKLKKSMMADVFIEAGQSAAAEKVSGILSGEKIRHMFLKGYVMRKLYPSPEMRTSCDVDLLISPSDVESAKNVLVQNGFTFLSEEEKDLHFTYPPNVHIELHRFLAEEVYRDGNVYFADAIDRAVQEDGYRFSQTAEDFYVYMIFHLAKHFVLGGSGVRSVLDIYIYQKKVSFCRKNVEEQLEKLGLSTFEKSILLLGRVWMGEEERTPFTDSLTDFVLDAGAFGKQENRIGLSVGNKEKGRFRYFLSRAFPPYSVLKYRFPVLKKVPVLLPLCWFWRFFDVVRPSRKQRIQNEISLGLKHEDDKNMITLYKQLGIYEVL